MGKGKVGRTRALVDRSTVLFWMWRSVLRTLLMSVNLVAASAACGATGAGRIDAARLHAANTEPQNWFTGGRDQYGTYFSPLRSINDGNVGRLGFAWQYDLGTRRGQQATPIVVDGVMYSSGTWGYVYAVDAATGREIWRFDPHVDGQVGRNPCCDIVNRGVAVWQGRVYVASLDGRLHALDAATGRPVWEADSIIDHAMPYASTGAPQIAHGNVIIGNAGGDMEHGGVRGYVSAYDLQTGALKWRFFTVPPAPGRKFEHPELALAARSWSGARDPALAGGGAAWDGTAYDPDLNLFYVGTGNAAPYDARQLGPGNGDHLFTASILALDADSGKMAWYYQTTPRDHWDFDAVQKFVLADLRIGGTTRHVIMQANKNGFFYVLDRATGALISANAFTTVTWAKGIDPATGRPILADQGDYYASPKNVYPSWAGGHTWSPMSFDPRTGLVYMPVIDAPSVWDNLPGNKAAVKYIDGFFTTNSVIADDSYDAASMQSLYGPMPELATLRAAHKGPLVRELLRAWNPVEQRTVWEVETSAGMRGYDGGVASTAGNLVLQGRGTGALCIYAADTGRVLKVIETGSHIMAAPMTYSVHGVQYVAVQVGYGGTAMAVGAIPPQSAALRYENVNRIIAFRLDGGSVPRPPSVVDQPFPPPPPQTATPAQIRLGKIKFAEQCSRCHVFGPSVTPDLRKLSPEAHAAFRDIVLHGMFASAGMGRFDDVLSAAEVDAIHAYLISQEREAYKMQEARK
jgi:quinohemoprotein ethanol dehydrogenase